MKKIYIHVGHGGEDSGAVGSRFKEKDITLTVAKILRDNLKSNGFEVDMSRVTDVKNVNAPEKANNFKADVVISLHCNSYSDESARGVETYVYKFGGEAEKIANIINPKVAGAIKTLNRGVKKENFEIIRETVAPAILIEMGFLTNPDEEKKLSNSQYQTNIAMGITSGLLQYFDLDNTGFGYDNIPDKYAKEAVDWAIEKGILKGDDSGSFLLHKNITRQDAIVFLYRAINK